MLVNSLENGAFMLSICNRGIAAKLFVIVRNDFPCTYSKAQHNMEKGAREWESESGTQLEQMQQHQL